MKEENRIIFYSKFENVDHISEEAKREFLDRAIENWPPERVDNLERFFEKKLNSKSLEYRKALNDISIIRRQYQRVIKNGFKPSLKKRSSLYDRFRDYAGTPEEKMIEIVDTLFNLLSEPRRNNITNYIDGLIPSRSQKGKKAMDDIYSLKEQYKRYINKGLMPGEKKRLYDRFLDIPGVSMEEKIRVVDYLLNKDQARKKRVLAYINNGIKRYSEEGRLAHVDLTILQQQYKNCFKNVQLEPQIKSLYDRFPKENTAIKMMIVDILVLTLSEDEQVMLKEYLNKKYNTKTSNDRRVFNMIKSLVGKYNRINLSDEKKSLLYSAMMLVEEKFRINGFSKEEYDTYKDNLLKQVISANPKFNIEVIIVSYINLAYQDLKEDSRNFGRVLK